MEGFAIKSKHFSLLRAFKEEAEKLGWVYNSKFADWKELTITETTCLYFADNWNGINTAPSMALSNASIGKIYELPLEWNAALGALKINKDVEVTIQEIANWKGVPAKLIKIKQ